MKSISEITLSYYWGKGVFIIKKYIESEIISELKLNLVWSQPKDGVIHIQLEKLELRKAIGAYR